MNPGKVPVSVITVSFNTKELTLKALRALYNSSVLPEQVIMVDNDSKDGSVEAVKQEFPAVSIIANKENLGFAKANNQAIRQLVNQPFVWLLNSDTETGTKSLEQLYNYINLNPKIGALGPQLVYPTRELQSVGGWFPTIFNVLTYLIPVTFFMPKFWRRKFGSIAIFPQPIPETGLDLEYVTGAASMLRKSALDQVGLLSEEHFMYFEETDLCWRLRKAGWELRVINTEPVMHVYGGSYKTKYDPRRTKMFLDSLRLFVNRNYRGISRVVINMEISLLGRLSVFLKSLKNRL